MDKVLWFGHKLCSLKEGKAKKGATSISVLSKPLSQPPDSAQQLSEVANPAAERAVSSQSCPVLSAVPWGQPQSWAHPLPGDLTQLGASTLPSQQTGAAFTAFFRAAHGFSRCRGT